MSLQMHVISGFVGGIPDTREVTTAKGKQSVNNPRKRDTEPVWYRVTTWNGLGITVVQHVDKGNS